MIAVVQPTDTDVAFPLKCAATRCRNELRRELAEKARLEDVQPVYRCGRYEVLRTSYEACRHVEKQNEETTILLASLRRNGFLAFRPNVDKGTLERCDDQPWAQDFKQGCHRVKNSWTENRHCFLDPAGKPLEPDWKGSWCGVTKFEDMEDAEQHCPEVSVVKLSSLKEKYPNGIEQISIELDGDVDISEELPEMGSGYMWILEQARAERKIDIDPHLTSQRKPGQASKKLIEKQQKRAKQNRLLRYCCRSGDCKPGLMG